MLKKLWQKYTVPGTGTEHTTPETLANAQRAKDEAGVALRETRERKPRIDDLVRQLHAQRPDDLFGQVIESTLRGAG